MFYILAQRPTLLGACGSSPCLQLHNQACVILICCCVNPLIEQLMVPFGRCPGASKTFHVCRGVCCRTCQRLSWRTPTGRPVWSTLSWQQASSRFGLFLRCVQFFFRSSCNPTSGHTQRTWQVWLSSRADSVVCRYLSPKSSQLSPALQ